MRLKLLAAALLSMLGAGECQADKRVALVVGNSRYQNVAPLNNPGHDAALMAETLRSAGFSLVGNGARTSTSTSPPSTKQSRPSAISWRVRM